MKSVMAHNYKKHIHSNLQKAFTVVEILVVAPIVILVIGFFISSIVDMTGKIIVNRGSDSLEFALESALLTIEQDVKNSGGYLATNNFTVTLPQGLNNDATAFTNVDSATTGSTLILNAYSTDSNPLSPTRNVVYANSPNACTTPQISQNHALMSNVVYFVKQNPNQTYTLWRRTLMPPNYTTIGCVVPWQQPSCADGLAGAMCKTNDKRLVDGLDVAGFKVEYYTNGTASINTNATNSSVSNNDRQVTLASTNRIKVTLSASIAVAGRSISKTGNAEITSPNDKISPTGDKKIKVLVVGGGGGGGSSSASTGGGGGGGGGGVIYNDSYEVSTGDAITVTVGNGGNAGTAGSAQSGTTGADSVFETLNAKGGGYGGGANLAGGNGGSGGGGGYNNLATSRAGGTGTAGQGFHGGATSNLAFGGGAGGGGASGGGLVNQANDLGGRGGNGIAYPLSGVSIQYGAGGNGGSVTAMANVSPANTGKGGDGAYLTGSAYAGAKGVVIVSYPTGSLTVNTTATQSTVGSYTVLTFSSNGSLTIL